ncbi:MAG TPA: alpha-amylase family glycosyl hydrolase [Candidatus Acidoferrum sp.]|nr:alpha-amylase family glycosyl hydrolase [Candidatus Acidoferrum sp.]
MRELSERAGRSITLAGVPRSEFEQWRRFGFTYVWLMGVWGGGPRARELALAEPRQRREYSEALPGWQDADVGGSPYAIAEYRVASALGGPAGLQVFRDNLHALGLKLLLDFVPNHVGLDHPWLHDRPELFVRSPGPATGFFQQDTVLGPQWLAHGKDPNFPAWTDTAQLDYRLPQTRAAMIEQLQTVAAACDGVRCDMAMLLLNDVFAKTWERFPTAAPAARPEQPGRASVPASPVLRTEFWAEAISAVKQASPGFLFLAEAYWGLETRLQELGFDYTYDKLLYDSLLARDPAAVQRYLLGMTPPALAASARFLENHDEPRIASLLTPAEHRAAALLILALPGMRLLHEGQLSGAARRTPIQLLRRLSEPANPDLERMYDALLTTLANSSVGQGSAELLAPRPAWTGNPTCEDFVIIEWKARPPDFDVVVINLAAHPSQCYAPVRIPALSAQEWSLQDLLGDEHYVRSSADLQDRGLYLDVAPHSAQLFHFTPL